MRVFEVIEILTRPLRPRERKGVSEWLTSRPRALDVVVDDVLLKNPVIGETYRRDLQELGFGVLKAVLAQENPSPRS
jgi:hypothetical protein